MKILNSLLLLDFSKKHADAEKSIHVWQRIVVNANWKSRSDVLFDFPRAKMLKGKRARFEIVHNKYRLIGEILYEEQIVVVRFIGTHKEYDKIDPVTVNMRL